jgi:hypothetical protein
MTRLRLQGLVLVLATAALLSTWAGAANAYIYPDSTRTYAVGHVHSSSSWNAARATIGVKSGIIGSGDLGSVSFYGFIAEVLWIMPESRSGSVGWCEIGYRRGFKGYDMLTPYWENNLNGQDYTHQVTQVPIAPGDAPEFKIVHYGTGTAWRFYINGNPAKDQFSDYTADTSFGSTFRWIDAGLEANATDTRLGSSSGWITITQIQKSSNAGSTWSFGPAAQLPGFNPSGFDVIQFPDNHGASRTTFGGWRTGPNGSGTPGQNLWNYRNQNAP